MTARPGDSGVDRGVRCIGAAALAVLLALSPFTALSAGAQADTVTPADAPDVAVVREHLFLTRGPAGAEVLHLLEVVNLGPRPAARVPLPVPAGAQWEQVPEEVAAGPDGLVDPRPLAVGERREYALAYTLPWREPMVLRRPLLYPTEELWLWAEAASVTVRGLRLVPAGRDTIEGREFVVSRMERLEPHAAWQVVLERPGLTTADLPVLARGGLRGDPVEVLAQHPVPRWALAALVLAGVVWAVRRVGTHRRKADQDSRRPAGAAGSVKNAGAAAPAAGAALGVPMAPEAAVEVERLKEEIVRLDVAYQNGELDEDVYRERRTALKASLLHLMGSGGGTPS